MLLPLHLGPIRHKHNGYVPPFVQPLVDAAHRGEDLAPVLVKLTHSYGFDTIMYGAALSPDGRWGAKQYVYTNLPRNWLETYDENDYVDVDPRVQHILVSGLPLIWDHYSALGVSAARDRFLRDALSVGVGSGVSFAPRDPYGRAVCCAFNLREPKMTGARREQISRVVGDLIVIGSYLHELYAMRIVQANETGEALPPLSQGSKPSPRQLQCLQLAAEGKRNKEIAAILNLSEATIQLHFDSVRSKLNAKTRSEALLKASQLGLIRRTTAR